MITYEHITGYELYEEMCDRNYPQYMKDNGFVSYIGMHYFSYQNLKESGEEEFNKTFMYIVARKADLIVGVLKLRKYEMRGSRVSDYNTEVQGYKFISFVDVHKDYRRQGILTGLYTYLNENLINEGDYLVGTGMSPTGRLAKVHALRKKLVTKAICFGDIYDFEESFQQII